MEQREEKVWFAMRATYRRELIAQRQLTALGIDCFVPMRQEMQIKGGRRRRRMVPAIHNLIFVYVEPSVLQAAKSKMPYLQYIIRKGRIDRSEKIVVPTEQMQRFIALTGTLGDEVMYLGESDISLTEGMRVRIHGGNCDGQEGVLLKLKGFRSRKVIVAIEGLIAVILAHVTPEQIEVIEG